MYTYSFCTIQNSTAVTMWSKGDGPTSYTWWLQTTSTMLRIRCLVVEILVWVYRLSGHKNRPQFWWSMSCNLDYFTGRSTLLIQKYTDKNIQLSILKVEVHTRTAYWCMMYYQIKDVTRINWKLSLGNRVWMVCPTNMVRPSYYLAGFEI